MTGGARAALVTFAGGSGEIVRVDGERFTMVATCSFAPGTPLGAQLGDEPLQLKVSRCARRADGQFDIEGRIVNLTRAQRELFAGLVSRS